MVRLLPCCFLLAALGLFFEPVQAQPAKSETGKGDSPAKKAPPDKMKFPAGIIFYLDDLTGNAVRMNREEFQKLLARLEAIESLLKGDREPPSSCKLRGELKGDVVHFVADFEFECRASSRIALGMLGAQLSKEGSLDDGKLPHLEFGDDGFSIVVEEAGRHKLRLEFDVPVGLRRAGGGSEREFEVSLPGAAFNSLVLQLPPAVKELRHDKKLEKRRKAGAWELTPKASDKKLIVSWKDPLTSPGAQSSLNVKGEVSVTLEESQTLISADLTLQVQGGSGKEWQLLLHPEVLKPQGKVEVDPGVGEIIKPTKGTLFHKLKLNEETSEPVHVIVQYRLARNFAKIPVGPFSVDKADRQEGTITVKATPEALRGVRLDYLRHGLVTQREPSGALASFQYWSVPATGKTAGIPLEIDLKKEKAQVVAELDHHLHMKKGTQVAATTRIKILSLTGQVDYLLVQLPRSHNEATPVLATSFAPFFPGFFSWPAYPLVSHHLGSGGVPLEYSCQGDGSPEMLPPDGNRLAKIKLGSIKTKEIVLKGTYQLDDNTSKARLDLPRLVAVPEFILTERGGKVTTEVDANHEIVPEAGELLVDRHKHTAEWNKLPAFVEFSWRPFRPPFVVGGTVDVVIKDDHWQVTERLDFSEAAKANHGRPVSCKVPANIQPNVGVRAADGKIVFQAADAQNGIMTLPKEASVYIEYRVPLPVRDERKAAAARTMTLPLLWPMDATRIDAKVRFWSDTGAVPALVAAKPRVWFHEGAEIAPDKDSLPVLVLRASGIDLPLQLRLQDAPPAAQSDVVMDRGVIQVQVDDDGQLYRARFWIRKFNAPHVELEFPHPVSSLAPNVYLNGKRVHGERNGTVLRVPVPAGLDSKSTYLDVEYRLRVELLDDEPFWQTEFHPPLFRGNVFLPRVGWHVYLKPEWTALVGGDSSLLDYHWAFHNGLLKPEPPAVNEFEGWKGTLAHASGPASVVFWRPSLGPVRVAHAPWQAWILLCSGLVLLVGLVINFTSLSRFVFWLLMSAVVVGLLAARFVWPTLLPMLLYGCQPGLLMLAVVLSIQWFVRERYRRQLVFLPGFSRAKGGSSMIRGGVARSTVPSTVDAPPPSGVGLPGSSVNKMV